MARRKLAAGNWKMNLTPAEGAAFAEKLVSKLDTKKTDVVLCVPFTSIEKALGAVSGSGISIGAQNMHFEDKGAFTGEISPVMLKAIGVKYVILGHSERRQYFAETDRLVNKKTIKALETDLIPIVCVGESMEEREEGITIEKVSMQVKLALHGISGDSAKDIIIAYEPIWAIGTGKTATSAEAQEVCSAIRACIKTLYGEEISQTMRILYGGSVDAKNAKEIFNMPDIDGALIGGASLKDDFEVIVNQW